MEPQSLDYCREIETYLCQKNDGHLVRVVGPFFDLVSGWAAQGVPLKVVCSGIDRCFERYYRARTRRRPLRIDFCEADVLDAFDEWRRALGLLAAFETQGGSHRSSVSLSAHLERVLLRLTSARAGAVPDEAFDTVIDRAVRELNLARADARGIRGAARQALIDRLAALDRELLQAARASLDEPSRDAIGREADEELAGFRASMSPGVFARAREAAFDRLVRERFDLPTISFA